MAGRNIATQGLDVNRQVYGEYLALHTDLIAGKPSSVQPVDFEALVHPKFAVEQLEVKPHTSFPWQSEGSDGEAKIFNTKTEKLKGKIDFLRAQLGIAPIALSKPWRRYDPAMVAQLKNRFTISQPQIIQNYNPDAADHIAWRNAAFHHLVELETEYSLHIAEQEARQQFFAWVEGRGEDKEYASCVWVPKKLMVLEAADRSNPNAKLLVEKIPSMKEFERSLIKHNPEFMRNGPQFLENIVNPMQTDILKRQLASTVPKTLEEAWLFYWYIVREMPIEWIKKNHAKLLPPTANDNPSDIGRQTKEVDALTKELDNPKNDFEPAEEDEENEPEAKDIPVPGFVTDAAAFDGLDDTSIANAEFAKDAEMLNNYLDAQDEAKIAELPEALQLAEHLKIMDKNIVREQMDEETAKKYNETRHKLSAALEKAKWAHYAKTKTQRELDMQLMIARQKLRDASRKALAANERRSARIAAANEPEKLPELGPDNDKDNDSSDDGNGGGGGGEGAPRSYLSITRDADLADAISKISWRQSAQLQIWYGTGFYSESDLKNKIREYAEYNESGALYGSSAFQDLSQAQQDQVKQLKGAEARAVYEEHVLHRQKIQALWAPYINSRPSELNRGDKKKPTPFGQMFDAALGALKHEHEAHYNKLKAHIDTVVKDSNYKESAVQARYSEWKKKFEEAGVPIGSGFFSNDAGYRALEGLLALRSKSKKEEETAAVAAAQQVLDDHLKTKNAPAPKGWVGTVAGFFGNQPSADADKAAADKAAAEQKAKEDAEKEAADAIANAKTAEERKKAEEHAKALKAKADYDAMMADKKAKADAAEKEKAAADAAEEEARKQTEANVANNNNGSNNNNGNNESNNGGAVAHQPDETDSEWVIVETHSYLSAAEKEMLEKDPEMAEKIAKAFRRSDTNDVEKRKKYLANRLAEYSAAKNHSNAVGELINANAAASAGGKDKPKTISKAPRIHTPSRVPPRAASDDSFSGLNDISAEADQAAQARYKDEHIRAVQGLTATGVTIDPKDDALFSVQELKDLTKIVNDRTSPRLKQNVVKEAIMAKR